MDALTHHVSAWDGLPLVVREWRDGDRLTPLLCLPGLVRTSLDFDTVARTHGAGRRVVSLDYPGRGGSGRSRDITRYGPEACLGDVLDVCAALHLHQVVTIGTSFGGLLSMGLAAARPGLIRAAVINDIGPEVGAGGSAFVREFVGHDPALPSLAACVDWLRERLPPLSLTTDEDWRIMAELTYAAGEDGCFHPLWDTRIARLMDRPAPDLWPLFGALAHVPLLLIRGEASNILLPDTVARMRMQRPEMAEIALPGIGHAPTLAEPVVEAALRAFLDRLP